MVFRFIIFIGWYFKGIFNNKRYVDLKKRVVYLFKFRKFVFGGLENFK